MMTGPRTVTCPACHYTFKIPSYAEKITKLSRGHLLCLEALRSVSALYDPQKGIPIAEIVRIQANISMARKKRPLKHWSVVGRLSELKTKKLVGNGDSQIELMDAPSMQFRHSDPEAQRWWATREGMMALENGGNL